MYAGYTTSPPLTNNPFIADGGTNPTARYPDLSTPPVTNQQQYGWGNGALSPVTSQQQQQGLYQQQYPQQQQSHMTMGPEEGPLSSLQVALDSSYGYLQGQQQPQGNPNAYNPAQQQLQSNPGYIAQFDPYSSIEQVWGDQNQNQHQNQSQQGPGAGMGMAQSFSTGSSTASGSTNASTGSWGISTSGEPHPRDFIRTHKAEVEAWDNYAWKQLLGSFEALMRAWEARKGELAARVGELSAQISGGMAYGGYYAQIQQEGARLQGLQKEAENNFDSVAASLFQLREVFAGYRQSGDLASKRRVREATNAALQGLPAFPQSY